VIIYVFLAVVGMIAVLMGIKYAVSGKFSLSRFQSAFDDMQEAFGNKWDEAWNLERKDYLRYLNENWDSFGLRDRADLLVEWYRLRSLIDETKRSMKAAETEYNGGNKQAAQDLVSKVKENRIEMLESLKRIMTKTKAAAVSMDMDNSNAEGMNLGEYFRNKRESLRLSVTEFIDNNVVQTATLDEGVGRIRSGWNYFSGTVQRFLLGK
jgi:hypothetical protein